MRVALLVRFSTPFGIEKPMKSHKKQDIFKKIFSPAPALFTDDDLIDQPLYMVMTKRYKLAKVS